MARPNRQQKIEQESRRLKVAELYVRRFTQRTIAKQIGVSLATITRDIKAVEKGWQQTYVRDMDNHKRRELAELDMIESDMALQYNATHDPGYIDRRIKCKQERAKLLGLYAPAKSELTGAEGGPVEVKVVYDEIPEWQENIQSDSNGHIRIKPDSLTVKLSGR